MTYMHCIITRTKLNCVTSARTRFLRSWANKVKPTYLRARTRRICTHFNSYRIHRYWTNQHPLPYFI